MTNFKKFVFLIFAAFLVLLILPSAAAAVTVDGVMENVEWKGTEKYILISSGASSNCSIDFAMLRIKIDNSKQAVYLGFQATQKQADILEPSNTLAGIRFTLEGNDYITCTPSGTGEYNINAYDVESIVSIGSNNDFTAEIRIGFKYGIPEKAVPGMQIVDGYGQPSNYYEWPVEPTTEATTTEKVTTTKRETTTKAPTTAKPTTTKAPTTAKPTTTKAPTTAKPTTTKAPTTAKPTTTKAPTTAKPTTTKAPAAQTATETYQMPLTVQTAAATAEQNTAAVNMSTIAPSNAAETKIYNTSAVHVSHQHITSSAAESIHESSISQPGILSTQNETATIESSIFSDETENPSKANNTTGVKQIIATAVAVLLIAVAVILSVFAETPKKNSEPEKNETQDDTDNF